MKIMPAGEGRMAGNPASWVVGTIKYWVEKTGAGTVAKKVIVV